MPRLSIFALGAAAALSLLQGVSGHYQLLYPQSRGFSEDTEPTAPCGGFNQVLAQRAEFPLHGGFLEINSEHTQYAYQIKLALGNNPDSNAFANASTVGGGQRNYPLQSCLSVDLSNVTQATDGTNATFQIMYNAGDSILYQVSCYSRHGVKRKIIHGLRSPPHPP